MRVALTGVSGFIGSVLAKRLHHRNYEVTGMIRPSSRRDHIEGVVDRLVIGDQADESVWPEFLADADCVIHNSFDWTALGDPLDLDRHLAANLLGSIRLLHAAAPRQFIFISTIAVHHDMRPRWAGVIDEDHPLRPGNLYGAYKAAVESHLWAAHYEGAQHTCAFRPCGVYGIDPRLSRSIGFPIIRSVTNGESFTRPGGGKFVHVDDVADAVIAAIDNPNAAGKAYNMVDCYARWADWAQIVAELVGNEVEIDFSSPAEPKNTFTKDAVESLGVQLDRGMDGVREHLRELIEIMKRERESV